MPDSSEADGDEFASDSDSFDPVRDASRRMNAARAFDEAAEACGATAELVGHVDLSTEDEDASDARAAGDPVLTDREKAAREEAGRCALCAFGNTMHDAVHCPGLIKLQKDIMEHYRTVSRRTLAAFVAMTWNREIYPKAKATNNDRVWPMTVDEALLHLNKHIKHPMFFVGETIERTIELSRLLYRRVVQSLSDPNRECDNRAVDKFQGMVKLTLALYNTDPTSFAFADPGTDVDPKRLFPLHALRADRPARTPVSSGLLASTEAIADARKKRQVALSRDAISRLEAIGNDPN